jgi:hypothetical protein
MAHIVEHEGIMRLFKGVGPQLLKGILVQGILNMTKERCVEISPPGLVPSPPSAFADASSCRRMEIYVLLLLRYISQLRAQHLQKLATKLGSASKMPSPVLLK